MQIESDDDSVNLLKCTPQKGKSER